MSFFCGREDLETESDVEQKLLYPLLTSLEGLGLDPSEVKTKGYLPPLDIDKGAGKKTGYFPDYALYLASIPVLVVEAKAPHETAESGFREAQLYAHEMNKRFPSSVNPVTYVISCNGVELYFGTWEASPMQILSFDDLQTGSGGLQKILDFCCRSKLLEIALEARRKLLPAHQYRPLSILGGPPLQNRELAPNSFARDLIPLLRAYFGPEARETPQFLRRAYVSSKEVTQYNEVLESLLKDNLSRRRNPTQISIETTKTAAPEFEQHLKAALDPDGAHTQSQLLIIGDVGVGKSLFLDRFYYFLMDDDLRSSTAWAILDFNNAPDEMGNIEHWICEEFLREFPARNKIADFLSRSNLEHYFAQELTTQRKGPYANLVASQPEEYERRIADDLARWMADPEKLVLGVIRHFQGDRRIPVVVVFDNVDRRDRQQQLRIFQATQWFRSLTRCFALTCLRDETYDQHKREPPLDAIYPLLVFRVAPPRFLDVAKRRVELALEELTASVEKKRSYQLPSGARVEYPASRLGEFLMAVYLALFRPSRKLRLLLEAIAGKNVRRALQMFTDILISGHLGEDRLFTTTLGKTEIRLPEWLVIRILMRTKYQYFASEHGYVLNILDVDTESPSTSNFLLIECLNFLANRRKKRGTLGIEGYVWVRKVVDELSTSGYTREDVFWALERLLGGGLISAEHMRRKGVELDDYVKISASGFFHLKVLLPRVEYLAAAATDCWYRTKEQARSARGSDDGSR